jgi:D-glycero-D-manno-heptose 1,7-bisphosphate phosphatase
MIGAMVSGIPALNVEVRIKFLGEKMIRLTETKSRILYLDIDGTVRHGFDELGRFVNNAADVRVFPEVPNLLRIYKKAGWRIVAISNQGGIALGLMSMEDCAEAMLETNRQCGNLFDKITWCQHHPDARDPEFAFCWCRKPRAGMVIETALDLARQHHEYYPPHLSLFVGDRAEDQECAKGANVPFMWAKAWREQKTISFTL